MSTKQLPLLDTGPGDSTRRANQISKRASKRRRAQAAYRQLRLDIIRDIAERQTETKRRKRWSPETVRDSAIPVEPLNATEAQRALYVRFRTALALQGTFEPLPGVPATRGQCPPDRHEMGCPFVRCRHHLWRLDGGVDGNRAGRPGLGSVPRNEQGLTLRVLGDLGGSRPGTTLEPRWLEHPLPVSCALDVADTGPKTNEEVGAATNRHRTLVARENKRGLAGAVSVGEKFGMSSDDVINGFLILNSSAKTKP